MDCHTDYFHHLPVEVIQLIFSRITDCKTLVQCMSVSKAFRQQAVCVPSLSIVCPGSFSSYDERLHKIYAMVKAFRNLQSLIVRVGQPKEELPSWARCMRYAEIGGSVEKFMFMAAKCGDFSELDSTLLGLDDMEDKLPGRFCNGSDSFTPLETDAPTDLGRQDIIPTSNTSISMEEADNRNTEGWSDIESDEEGGQRGLLKARDHPALNIGSEQRRQEKTPVYSRLTPSDASFLFEPGKRKSLSQFSLRQVIAPSNDVLKRMLPVIHFAIVQGLNELRDSLPAFVAQFAELKTFLLVDMVESITVFMREHHIQELKSLYLQDWDGLPNSQFKGAPILEPCFSELDLVVREGQPKSLSCKMGGEKRMVGVEMDSGHSAVSDSKPVKCIQGTEKLTCESLSRKLEGVEMDSGHSEVSDSRWVNGIQGTEEVTCGGGSDQQNGDMPGTAHALQVNAHRSKDLAISVNEGCLRRETEELQSSSTSMHSTCNLALLQSCSTKRSEACKGKEKLSEYQDYDFQGSTSGTDMRCNDYSKPASAECPVEGSIGGNVSGMDARCNDYRNLVSTECRTEGSIGGCSTFFLKEVKGDPMSRLSHTTEQDLPSQSISELRPPGELNSINDNKGTTQQPQLSHVEGLDGKLDWHDEDHGKASEDVYKLHGLRYTRDAKVDLTNKHLLKRCHKSDTLKKKDFCKSLRFSGGIRGSGSLSSNDFVEDVDVQRSQIHICEDMFDKSEQVSKDKLALAGSAHDYSLEASCSSGVICAKHEGVTCAVPISTDGGGCSNREGVLEGSKEDVRQTRSEESSIREPQIVQSEANEIVGERPIDVDAWRHAWHERVRRLRDSLRVVPGQELEQTHGDRQERSRELLRKRHRHRAMEKDALSFDYTFWRAEQVSSSNYVMSDISMCIATHAARPLRDAEKKVLTQAAIAGPLLVATVSHVNKNYNCHNL